MGLALVGALLIGLSLGLLGSGGSILTVPVLTYLVGQDEKVAIAGSLAIVATISFVAGIPYALKRTVDGRSILLFGVPGMVGAYGGAWASKYVSGSVQLIAFAVLMLAAGVLMLKGPVAAEGGGTRRAAWKIVVDGLVVGAITGFVGVGGGFLIVPALVLMGGLTMRRAVGTSLFIIALKSTTGFAKYVDVLDEQGLSLDYEILGIVAGVGILGSFVGGALGSRMPQELVRRIFAVGLFVVGSFVIYDNVSKVRSGDGAESPVPQARIERATAARDLLFTRLAGELQAALTASGPAAAIEVCSRRAPEIAREVSDEQRLRIGRTSERLRNPANGAPDWARDHVLKGDAPIEPAFTTENGVLHALFPIVAGELCLKCHGAPDTLADEVTAALAERYPSDHATGYAAGDLRGWFWVELE